MGAPPKLVLWIDLETTGTNELEDLILEVGCVLTDLELNEVDRRSRVINPEGWGVDQLMDDYVTEMHTNSGLLDEIPRSDWTIGTADTDLSKWVYEHAGTDHVWAAGSGVAHFDLRFIRYRMPKLAKRLTYHTLDVGVLRRACQAWAPQLVPPDPDKPHRAMDDILEHLEEGRYYRRLLAGALPPVPDDPYELGGI